MKKSGLVYIFIGIFFYILFLIIQMPSSWIAWGLSYYTNGLVHLDPISGTLWHGTGRLTYRNSPSTSFEFGETKWRINPLWLLVGSLQLNWQSRKQETEINATVRFGSGRLMLLDTNVSLSARHAGTLIPAARFLSPTGQMQLQTDKLAMDRDNGMSGGGDIQWLSAGSALSTVNPLGDYRLLISGAGKTANLKLSTLRGALELSGQGQWQPLTGIVQFSGSAAPRDRISELEPLLKFMGENQGEGKRTFTFNGRLPHTIF